MNYFVINFTDFRTIVLKAECPLEYLPKMFAEKYAIVGPGGMIFNLKNYDSLYQVTNPSEKQKLLARTMTDII